MRNTEINWQGRDFCGEVDQTFGVFGGNFLLIKQEKLSEIKDKEDVFNKIYWVNEESNWQFFEWRGVAEQENKLDFRKSDGLTGRLDWVWRKIDNC